MAIGVASDSSTQSLYITGVVGGSVDGQAFGGGLDIALFRLHAANGSIAWTSLDGGPGFEFGWQLTMGATSQDLFVVGFMGFSAFV